MRIVSILLLLLPFLSLKAQYGEYDGSKWHAGVGLTGGTINFQQNGVGALTFPIRYDFLTLPNSSFSLGTYLKVGSEDEYGASFPAIVTLIGLLSLAGDNYSGFNGSNGTAGTDSSYSISFFADFPLLLQYNWGLGTANGSNKHFGWFVGGGATYTITGVTVNHYGHGTSANFFGWMGNVGVRFGKKQEISFSVTQPIQNSVGPIQHPLFFALTFAIIGN